MTVAELIEKLQALPSENLVIVAKDAEGNDYSPLHEVEECFYVEESRWSGYIDYYPDDEEPTDDDIPAVVLWPIN